MAKETKVEQEEVKKAPFQVKVSSSGGGYPSARKLPDVIGGTCEFCGTLDPKIPADIQYSVCPHYTGVDIKCSYCPPGADHDEIRKTRRFSIKEFPVGSGQLDVCCDDLNCRKRWEKEHGSSTGVV